METEEKRSIFWVGSSLRDLKKLPEEVQETFNFGLIQATKGLKHISAKPLKGFGGNSVLEIVEDHRSGLSTPSALKRPYMCFTSSKRKVSAKLLPRKKIWI